jgi:hypothetical protein
MTVPAARVVVLAWVTAAQFAVGRDGQELPCGWVLGMR